ncbi:GNAT family N-acetyltransferase [Desulfovibrio inopinatus]|uniref:GNAT family N-acetyltransferase n=1 Tax=Desulfovibrio inopinatus TaxID=102109 RepID=UPI00041142C7|nr:GNAT family N-acetyltransferase [Desulfovibrio inopinatus]
MIEIRVIQRNEEMYKEIRGLRYELFFAQHGLQESILDDEKELHSIHVAALDKQECVGYGRLTKLNENHFQISQMVVAPKYQGQGYGSILLNDLVTRAISLGAKEIVLNARTTAKRFYSKHGFIETGNVFPSKNTGVPHIQMKYTVTTS